jgi:hypothetical protein
MERGVEVELKNFAQHPRNMYPPALTGVCSDLQVDKKETPADHYLSQSGGEAGVATC